MEKKLIPDSLQEPIYELKQDIWTPAFYIRAGKRATEGQWKAKLGDFNIEWECHWFINLSEPQDRYPVDELRELINSVFSKYRLNSISYKEAAREIAELWLKQNQSK